MNTKLMDLGFGIWDLGFGIWDSGFWILDFGFWILDFKTGFYTANPLACESRYAF
ncbi:hypothetical protein F7734_59675 [Scytonema sp. UIC 10036]|uniref:hypothetical protein n=1 Tax=Scytonema sp. UIC 10036 TaxID=2304196 RepID=UPI0012DADC3E|nr:hypothetical protein [Scytonema sp. UIC 10036]MUH01756.1 hypothetical protein [Scytonema sp. UIC 10036]